MRNRHLYRPESRTAVDIVTDAEGNPAGRATRTTTQAIDASTATAVLFNGTEGFDIAGQHDPASNSDRITIADAEQAGVYLVHAAVTWDESAATAAGLREMRLTVDGTLVPGTNVAHVGDATNDHTQVVSACLDLDSGEIIRVEVEHADATDPLNITSAIVSWARIPGIMPA